MFLFINKTFYYFNFSKKPRVISSHTGGTKTIMVYVGYLLMMIMMKHYYGNET